MQKSLLLLFLVLLSGAGAGTASAQTRSQDSDLREDSDLPQQNPGIRVRERTDDPVSYSGPGDADPFWSLDRVLVGGGFGASFGTVLFVEASPTIAYFITPMLRFGIGGTYRYVNDQRIFFEYKAHVYGGRAFVQHDIFGGLFAHAEYENLRARYITGEDAQTNFLFPSALIGGGYAIPMGASTSRKNNREIQQSYRSMMQIQVLYPISLNSGFSQYFYPVDIRMMLLFNL